MTNTTPDAAQSKILRNQHPLYQKLSGDVIWVLYEERGFDAEACGKALDDFIDTMHRTVAVMQALESGIAKHFVVQGAARGCAYEALTGQIFSTDRAEWRKFLPPYAVGCSLNCRALEAAELQSPQGLGLKKPAVAVQDMQPPHCALFCSCLER